MEATPRQQLRDKLVAEGRQHEAAAQSQVTDRLEAGLSGIRAELEKVVTRVTAEVLKQKAAQLGRIKHVTEDTEAGSLTIVLEV